LDKEEGVHWKRHRREGVGLNAGATPLRRFRRCMHSAVPPQLLQTPLVAIVPRPAFWPTPLEPQSENKVTAISPASRRSLAIDLELSHGFVQNSSHANTQRRFHRITCSPTGLTILLSPLWFPHGAPHIGRPISSISSERGSYC
jgi:hypothetical protein